MNKIFILALSFTLFALAGCASMNEAECVTADWVGIGYEDGAVGRDPAYIGNRRSACADYGVTPDLERYRTGYDEGLAYFCRPENGFIIGRSGRAYTGLCPPQYASAFSLSYNEGRELFRISSAITEAGRSIESKRAQIAETRESITLKEARLIAEGTPTAERVLLLRDVRDLEQEIGRLEAETLELEKERAVLSEQYKELDASYSAF